MSRPPKHIGCSAAGCAGKHYGLGLCLKHYKSAHHAARYYADPQKENARVRAWEEKNKERVKATKAASYQRNKTDQLALAASKRAADPAKYRARVMASIAAHPDRVKASTRAYKKANPHKCAADRAKQKAALLRATPAWANTFFISEAYHLAALRTRMLGYKWDVDHIVPLRSKQVCGLHVEHNLRVIPAIVNMKKNNRHWPDMPT